MSRRPVLAISTVAALGVDAVNTNVASATDSGIRTVGATIQRPKGKTTRIVTRWDATLAPVQSGGSSLKAQSGDQFSIGVGTTDGNGAGETLNLADVPTC